MCINVPGKGDALAGIIDTVDHRRCVAMVTCNRRDQKTFVFKENLRHRMLVDLCRNVVCLDRERRSEITQVCKRAVLSEQQLEKSTGRRKIGVLSFRVRTRGTPNLVDDGISTRHGSRLEQSRQLTNMINV